VRIYPSKVLEVRQEAAALQPAGPPEGTTQPGGGQHAAGLHPTAPQQAATPQAGGQHAADLQPSAPQQAATPQAGGQHAADLQPSAPQPAANLQARGQQAASMHPAGPQQAANLQTAGQEAAGMHPAAPQQATAQAGGQHAAGLQPSAPQQAANLQAGGQQAAGPLYQGQQLPGQQLADEEDHDAMEDAAQYQPGLQRQQHATTTGAASSIRFKNPFYNPRVASYIGMMQEWEWVVVFPVLHPLFAELRAGQATADQVQLVGLNYRNYAFNRTSNVIEADWDITKNHDGVAVGDSLLHLLMRSVEAVRSRVCDAVHRWRLNGSKGLLELMVSHCLDGSCYYCAATG
jgi:hypothetical protein